MLKSKAKFKDASRMCNLFTLTFEVDLRDKNIAKAIDSLVYRDVELTATKWSDKRSGNANKYFHVLCSKIADALGTSNTYAKNLLLCEYGQYLTEGGEILTYTTKAPQEYIMELPDIHLKYSQDVIVTKSDGAQEEQFEYFIMRGSSSFNRAEMQRLIQGAVDKAKELNVDTLTPEEMEKLLAAWGE